MGGSISVESQVGRGSTFVLEVPMAAEDLAAGRANDVLRTVRAVVLSGNEVEAGAIGAVIDAHGGQHMMAFRTLEDAISGGASFRRRLPCWLMQLLRPHDGLVIRPASRCSSAI
jgi:hypothetical protein